MSPSVSEAAALYTFPIEEFVAERDRLSRRLVEQGKKEEAASVAKLRKPTTDAWALNQVARMEPDLIEQLVQVHQKLRQPNDPESLRRWSEERGRLLETIGQAAASILVEGGHSAEGSVRDRIARTLLAAGGDEATEHLLRAGTLSRAADIASGWPEVFSTAPSAPEEKAPDPKVTEELERMQASAEKAADRAEQAKAEAREARHVLEEARRRLDVAEDAAKQADREAREAKRAWDEARRQRR